MKRGTGSLSKKEAARRPRKRGEKKGGRQSSAEGRKKFCLTSARFLCYREGDMVAEECCCSVAADGSRWLGWQCVRHDLWSFLRNPRFRNLFGVHVYRLRAPAICRRFFHLKNFVFQMRGLRPRTISGLETSFRKQKPPGGERYFARRNKFRRQNDLNFFAPCEARTLRGFTLAADCWTCYNISC